MPKAKCRGASGSRVSWGRTPSHARQAFAHAVGKRFAVHGFFSEVSASCLDNRPHLLGRVCRGFRDCRFDGLIHFGGAGCGWQVGLDHGDFAGFFFSQLGSATLGKHLSRFFTLLDQSLQNLERFGIVEGANFLDFLVFQRRFHHAEDAQAQLVLGFHGFGKVFLNFIYEWHRWPKKRHYNTGSGGARR
jgi:hypothetical protein